MGVNIHSKSKASTQWKKKLFRNYGNRVTSVTNGSIPGPYLQDNNDL